MEIIKINVTTVDKAIYFLKKGGLVIYPTETVYGIGADATNQKAVDNLNNYKRRPFGKPYSVAVANISMAQKYVLLNEVAKNLYKEFLPGPLTIVSTGKHKLATGVESESGTLGIRIPDYKLVTDIVSKYDKPITATSANASYKKRPYQLSDILDNISEKQKKLVDLFIDAGKLPANEPSTVVDTTLDDLLVLRQGNINLKNKNEVYSRSVESTQNTAKNLWQKYETYKGKRPIIFALEGPMGAGKTQFTKGLAKAMGIKDTVISPSYSLEEEYDGGKLYHFDSWRMEDPQELIDLGFNERIANKNAVVAIEWAEKVTTILREHAEDTIIIWVKILYGKGDDDRLISWGAI